MKRIIGIIVSICLVAMSLTFAWGCSGRSSSSFSSKEQTSKEAVTSKAESETTATTTTAKTVDETEAATSSDSLDSLLDELNNLLDSVSENGVVDDLADLTMGQKNAVKKAQSYLEFSSFSKNALFNQLTSEYGERFSEEDGNFAISYLEENGLVDWYAEAAEAAQSYLEFSSFSKSGLYNQLTSEYGEYFSEDEAAYAIDYIESNNLVDWYAEAVEAAENYLEFSAFSRDGLYDQLTSEYGEGFTSEEAEYALGQVGY